MFYEYVEVDCSGDVGIYEWSTSDGMSGFGNDLQFYIAYYKSEHEFSLSSSMPIDFRDNSVKIPVDSNFGVCIPRHGILYGLIVEANIEANKRFYEDYAHLVKSQQIKNQFDSPKIINPDYEYLYYVLVIVAFLFFVGIVLFTMK